MIIKPETTPSREVPINVTILDKAGNVALQGSMDPNGFNYADLFADRVGPNDSVANRPRPVAEPQMVAGTPENPHFDNV